MGRVRIVRGNEMFCRFSHMNVFIDGNNVGTVEYLDYKDFRVSEGNHSLHIELGGFVSITMMVVVEASKPTIYSVKLPKRTFAWKEVLVNIFSGKSNIEFTPIGTDYRAEKYT
ncbi:PEGA domain-containing protein [Mucilaginibacter paludis]|uniref:PEGA domain-containing protein n=1 Tax=Mucilaginibacter paludis DSM 18603 TaxID=714943 RepID=H1Y3J4_9SPHI|nr:PEGA domain-containing protein [Mucilaginibacter paludis]EHQ29762.1 hypothetical protein Mucpa_5693 [Mucilaginibacter paludis DSM 18603]